MADTYLDSSVVGFNHQDALDARVDTYRRLSPIINMEDAPAINENFANVLSQVGDGPSKQVADAPKIDLGSALVSDDPIIKANALRTMDEQANQSLESKFGLGRTIETPRSEMTDKFTSKKFGFSALGDNEEFYYNNDYMRDGILMRNLVKNPIRFLGRVAVPAILKFGEGLGNIGAMFTSIGSNNYWADVADNGFSKWLEGLETSFKDQVAPVYKQAGFDEKGFFSKLLDWSFWNESVADGVAFMASAAIPGMGLAKLGQLGRFGEAFGALAKSGSLAQRAGALAGKVGLGSWAELTSWTFNTAMEASMEGAGVFKEMTRRMKEGRDNGDPEYADLTDDDIKERAGKMAGDTVAGNFLVLGMSNAFENTLFFKPFKNIEGRAAVGLGDDFRATSQAINRLEGKGGSILNSGLTRGTYYGKKIAAGVVAEGLWEENAQLAIQRQSQGDAEGRNFWDQFGKQTLDAFAGNDKEASESIGLGALIGAGAGVLLSKASGERAKLVENTRKAIEGVDLARQRLFSNNDIYERDKDNKIVFENNQPKVDPVKLVNKQKALETVYGKLSLANKEEFLNNESVQFNVKDALSNYVRSLNSIGVEGVAGRLKNLNPENAALFGLDPSDTNKGVADMADLAETFERHSAQVDELKAGKKPDSVTNQEWSINDQLRRAKIYKHLSHSAIAEGFLRTNNSELLASLNGFRNLNNASIAQFPVDQLNTLLIQRNLNNDLLNDKVYLKGISEVEKKYHEDRTTQLTDEIERFKKDNELILQDSVVKSSGYYTPTIKNADGTTKEVGFDKRSAGLQRKIADFNNVIDKNNYVATYLSDEDNWYENFSKISDTELMREARAAQKAAQAKDAKSNVVTEAQKRTRELVPGDFDKVNRLVAKMVFGENQQYNAEELQLQQNYAALIEQMMPEYEQVVSENTVNLLKKRYATLVKQTEDLQNVIYGTIDDIGLEQIAFDELNAQFELLVKNGAKKAEIQKITDALNTIAENINEAERTLEQQEADLAKMSDEAIVLEQEIESGGFKGLRASASEMKKEIDWLDNNLKETRSLLERVRQAVKNALNVVKKLFPKFDYKNIDRALRNEPETSDVYDNPFLEAKTRLDRQKELEDTITELEASRSALLLKYNQLRLDLDSILNDTSNFFKKKYQDLTKAKPIPLDADDLAISTGLGSEAPGISSGGTEADEEAGFDGETYQRPLTTKFFTTTFPRIEGDLTAQPQDIQDYFKFVEFVTNPTNGKALKEKLGKGKLEVLTVTKNNVAALKLAEALTDRKDYFKIDDAATTHVEIIPVIKDGGVLYYVDAELNKLGKVGEKPTGTIVRRSLRTAKFTDTEKEQYLKKYKQGDLDAAVAAGTAWRESLLKDTKAKPVATFEFSITRGIPNRMQMQDGAPAQNSVIGTLLDEKQVTGQTVRVSSTANPNYTINGEIIEIPAGRPFIYTSNGVHEQLHAANNQKLGDEQVQNVSAVLTALLEDHIKKVEQLIAKSTKFPQHLKDAIAKAGSINNLDPQMKKEVFLKVTSDPAIKGFRLLNSNYEQYLSSITHYIGADIKDKNGKERNRNVNTIFIKGYKLVLGENGPSIDITDPAAVQSDVVQNFLKGLHHNVKYFTDAAKSENPFIEYYVKDGKLAQRSWKNYSSYLLMPKFPDGTERTFIPITTSIKTQEQHDAEAGTEPYYPYVSRGITLRSSFQKTISKPKAAVKEVQVGDEEFEIAGTDILDDEATLAAARSLFGGKMKTSSKKKPSAPTKKDVVDEDDAETLRKASSLFGKKAKKPDPNAGIVPSYEDPDENDEDIDLDEYEAADGTELFADDPNADLPMGGMFRLAQPGFFKVESDLNGVIADIQRMIPQFPVQRLDRAIRVSPTQEAWAQFVDNTIKLYELAEEGTGYHEVFEAVANRLLSDREWRALAKEFTARKGSFVDRETSQRVNYKDATTHQIKEQLAEEFKDYKLGKKQPAQAQTKSYFKILWDFIKSFFSARNVIEDTFAKIDQGRFAKASIGVRDRFANNYRLLVDLPVAVRQDLLDGATGFMFEQVFTSPKSLTAFDAEGEIEDNLYEPIKERFRGTIRALEARYAKTKDEAERENYTLSIKYINHALDNWSEFKEAHKNELKIYRIKFEQQSEDIEKAADKDETQNRNDYLSDVFKIDDKKSASKSVRFLIGTLLKLNVTKDSEGNGKVRMANNAETAVYHARPNSVFMPSLADYDHFMLRALEEFQGLNDFTRLEQKLRDLAGISAIEDMDTPEAKAATVGGLSDDQAVWTSLYIKLFGNIPGIEEEAAWNLKVKFHNYISKHSPEPYIFINGGGSSTIISSTRRGFFETVVRKIEGSILTNNALVFQKKKIDGIDMYVPTKEFQTPTVFNDFKEPKKLNRFVEFLGLKDYINKDFTSKLTEAERNILINKLLVIRNALTTVKTTSINIKQLNIFNYISGDSGLISFLDDKLDISRRESAFLNIDNQSQQRHIIPSFISRLVSEINNVSTRAQLEERYPQISTLWANDSLLLAKLFDEDGNRTSVPISLGYMEGIKDLDDMEGTKSGKLEFIDKYYLQFNASLSGLYYSLPADSETEWVFNFGEFVNFSENMLEERGEEIINENFLPKLMTEIAVARESSDLLQLQGKHASTGRTIGESLRFFKNILPYGDKKLLADIHNEIHEEDVTKRKSPEQIVTGRKYKARINTAITNWINAEINNSVSTLVDGRVLFETEPGEVGTSYRLAALNSKFVEKNSQSFSLDNGTILMTNGQLRSLMQYQKINSILGEWETFKIAFGDPAQYKDWEKRAKSLFGPVEQNYVDQTGEFNEWLNENKNRVVLGDEAIDLHPTDMFSTEFSDTANSRTVDDIEVVNVDTHNDLVDLMESNPEQAEFIGKFIDQYEQTNEADGQSIGTIQFARHLMIKAGWRWSDEHEAYYQYDGALMRRDLSQSGKYSYDDAGLRELDEKIIAHYEKNPPMAALSPVKTLMPYVEPDGSQVLLKHSIHFMSYQVAKDFELLDLYVDMLNRNEQVFNFKSVQKIGLKTDSNGKVTPYYTNPFLKNDLDAAGNPIYTLDMKTIGVQVETQTSGKGQTLGSQLTKLSNLNILENGVPTDFKPEGKTASEALAMWDDMSEEERIATSPKYSLIQGPAGTVKSLENLKLKNTLDTFNTLGIKWKFQKNGTFTYEIGDLSKIKDYIHNELRRLAVDDNTVDNIALTDDYKEFINPAETVPSYTTISNLLWSMADKAVTSMKVNGKPYIQVASTFFNKGSRKAAVRTERNGVVKWVELNTKEEYDEAVANGHKPVMTSSELKFYRLKRDENGVPVEVEGMEIYLPHLYKSKVNKKREKMGLPALSDEQLMEHLNNNPKLLQGVGFRIPTQASSSLEFFTIKGFLPEAFGSAVVVPSGITTKAGSDFDVDKLNTYLNNFKLGKKGLPFYEEFKTDENSTVQERYDDIYGRKRKLLSRIEEYLQKNYEKEFLNKSANVSSERLINTILIKAGLDDISYYSDEEVQDVLTESFKFGNINYEDLIKQVNDEIAASPSIEEFRELPIALQNTKGAVENRYFESIRNVLKQPDMFAFLLSPNSVQHIKDMRDTVQKALDPEWQSEEKKEIDYTRFLSTEFLAEKRNQFTKGKYDIGIFAVAMTNFANSQVTGIGITSLGGVKELDTFVFHDLNEGLINLPFEDINMLTRKVAVFNGAFSETKNILMIPISTLQDNNGELTMDKLSAYINGAVDVARDPVIVEMGMHSELAGTYTLMERMGLTGKTTALFLYQPAIRDFLREIIYSKTYFSKASQPSQKKIIQSILDSYTGGDLEYDPKYKFTDRQLADMITKGELVKKGKATFTADENRAQRLALVNFLKMRMFSQHLLESIQASNHDTASIRSPYIITKKDLGLERSKSGSVITKIHKGKITNGTEVLRNETSVRTDVAMLKQFNSLFSRIGLFALQKNNPQATLNEVARRLMKENPFMSNDDFVAAMREYEAAMIDSLVNEVGINAEDKDGNPVQNELWKYAHSYFKTGSKSNLKKRFDSIKKTYKDYARQNFFLNNLEINTDQNLGIDLMELKIKPSNSDVTTRERITEGMLQLAQIDERQFPDLVEFYRAVVYGAYLQFGIKFSRKSFLDLIPVSSSQNMGDILSITDLTKPALEDIETADFSLLDEQVRRTKWHRKSVSPESTQFSVQFLSPDPENPGQFKLDERSTWRTGQSKPPNKGSQTFFAKPLGEEGAMIPHIHPIMIYAGAVGENKKWDDMPEIINIPAVKPEFLIRVEGKYGMENRTSSVVDKMRKRGDYSYLYNQLFKKVGSQDKSFGRGMITKGKKDKLDTVSYLYKPINKYGSRDFNEMRPLSRGSDLSVMGQKSILKFPEFTELTDADIVTNISKASPLIPVVQPKIQTVTTSLKPVSNKNLKPSKIKKSNNEDLELPPIDIFC